MMRKQLSLVLALALCLLTLPIPVFAAEAAGTQYTVVSGDTLWKISQRVGVGFSLIKEANTLTVDTLKIGQQLLIPPIGTTAVYSVLAGDSLWGISNKFGVTVTALKTFNNMTIDGLTIGQKIFIPVKPSPPTPVPAPAPTPLPEEPTPAPVPTNTVTNIKYSIVSGDNIWSLSIRYGLPANELMKVNNFTSSTVLSIGQVITIPVHYIAVKSTPGPQYGELLDWFAEAQYVLPIGATAKVIDLATGKTFSVKRTYGAGHADSETLTAADTAIMKEIWGGNWSWTTRAVLIITADGRKIAASVAGMPHAGLDAFAADITVANRTGNYGTGPNFDQIKGNGMDGHFDIHFLNSIRHKDGLVDLAHQAMVHQAAGI